MQARLSTICLGSDADCLAGKGPYPLAKLATRETDDPSIALLDAWATVADVLTFYQERIANEGFLRTATERRSILELARLVGYQLRPGVAASVYLALTVDEDQAVTIDPLQLRAQSVPGPGELPQTFENIEKFEARGRWSKLEPRISRPQSLKSLADKKKKGEDATIYLKGISTGLNQNDPVLIGDGGTPELYRVIAVNADAAADRTSVVVRPWLGSVVNAKRRALHAIISSFENPGVARGALNALAAELSGKRTNAELADFVEHETLPALDRLVARRNVNAALKERLKTVAVDIKKSTAALREL
jgi:hypothetical protein